MSRVRQTGSESEVVSPELAHEIRNLPARRWQEVVRAVERGQRVTDVGLAPIAVAYAALVQRDLLDRTMWRRIDALFDQGFWLLTAVTLAIVAGFALFRSWAYWVAVLVLAAAIVPLSRRRRSKRLKNALRAEELNRELLATR
jgi:hypothetical protein